MDALVMTIAARILDFVAKERASALLPQEGQIVEQDQHQGEPGPGQGLVLDAFLMTQSGLVEIYQQ